MIGPGGPANSVTWFVTVEREERQCGGLAPTPLASSSSPAGSPTATWPSCSTSRSPRSCPSPAALLHSEVPQPHGQVLYELVTGHPDRAPRELVFLADLTVELRAWPQQSAEEARALARPAMAYVREQLRARLAGEISRQYLRWLHPTSRRRPGDTFL
jgi:hypothetical protein